MTTHWAHVVASYALVLGAFAAMAVLTVLRHAVAKRQLAALDPRANRRGDA